MIEATAERVEISTDELYRDWVIWLSEARKASPNTVRLYQRVLETALREIPDLPNAPTEVLEMWVERKGGSPSSYSNRCSALTSFFRFMVKRKYRKDNPATEIDRPKRPRRIPKPVLNIDAVLDALIEQDRIANELGTFPRRVGETRDMAVFLMRTGLRIHEAVKFDAPVPCPDKWLMIGKGNKEANLLLDDESRECWNRLEGRWPIGARATQRRFEKVQHIERVTPHMWRHTLATLLVRGGIEIGTVSKVMRHESVATTMGYSAYAEEQTRQALQVLDGYRSNYAPQ